MSAWISTKDSLPEMGLKVLVYLDTSIISIASRRTVQVYGNDKVPYRWEGPGPFTFFAQWVSHWMPLPEGPEADSIEPVPSDLTVSLPPDCLQAIHDSLEKNVAMAALVAREYRSQLLTTAVAARNGWPWCACQEGPLPEPAGELGPPCCDRCCGLIPPTTPTL